MVPVMLTPLRPNLMRRSTTFAISSPTVECSKNRILPDRSMDLVAGLPISWSNPANFNRVRRLCMSVTYEEKYSAIPSNLGIISWTIPPLGSESSNSSTNPTASTRWLNTS